MKYEEIIAEAIEKWQRRRSRRLKEEWHKAALMLMKIDLEVYRGDLAQLYADSPRGRKPCDPVCMLRAVLLMTILQYEKIAEFAQELRRQPRLAIIAGFEPFKTPAVGTFYLFMDRVENGPWQNQFTPQIKPAQWRKSTFVRNLAAEKTDQEKQRKLLLQHCDSLSQECKDRLLANSANPRPQTLQSRLENLLIKTAVIPSAQRGLLGAMDRLIITGDGAALVSAASAVGQPTCHCRSKGIYKCDHDRRYSDATANWGYDSYRDSYYFGHTYYQHLVSSSGHDLPIHITIGQASESDFTLSLKSLDALLKAFQENGLQATVYAAAYDSGHDGYGVYQYLKAKDINSCIVLNHRTNQFPKPTGSAAIINDEGVPICPAGLAMRKHSAGDSRIYFNCPVKRPSHKDGKHLWIAYPQECPHQVLCQPDTKCGPVIYVRPDQDLRHYPSIVRGSKEYKEIINLRSGCERSNATKKVVHKLGNRVCRSASHYLIRLYLISIVEHAKAWLAEDRKLVGGDLDNLLQLYRPAA